MSPVSKFMLWLMNVSRSVCLIPPPYYMRSRLRANRSRHWRPTSLGSPFHARLPMGSPRLGLLAVRCLCCLCLSCRQRKLLRCSPSAWMLAAILLFFVLSSYFILVYWGYYSGSYYLQFLFASINLRKKIEKIGIFRKKIVSFLSFRGSIPQWNSFIPTNETIPVNILYI